MVGIHLALGLGLHRRLGWASVALAGVASNIPDWDGLPMLIDMAWFEAGHRVWGHNVLSIICTSLLLAATQVRWNWINRFTDWCSRKWGLSDARRDSGGLGGQQAIPADEIRFSVWIVIAMVAQVVHLPCDMVVSGGAGLSDWAVEPWWPWSHTGYVYPMIPWGDPGPTLILMAGALVIARWPRLIINGSRVTVAVLIAYLVVRRITYSG